MHNNLLELVAPEVQSILTRILHATSQSSMHHLRIDAEVCVEGTTFLVPLKTFRRDDLQTIQIAALQRFVTTHGARLRAHGLVPSP